MQAQTQSDMDTNTYTHTNTSEIARFAIGCKALYTQRPQKFTRGMEVVHDTE